jgi:monoamine oxidase
MVTRRQILARFTAVAGVAGGYAALHALGLTGEEAWAGMPDLQPGSGTGVKVVILGAGQAGLSSAYELKKAGFDVTIIEARDRVGGRNWTVRKGTEVVFDNGTKQTCAFDDGQYFNAGPARLPAHHQATLGYCRELGVLTEPEINWTGRARIQADRLNGGKAFEMRQAVYDFQGHMAELVTKVANKGALDDSLTKDDRDRLVSTLAQWGPLDKDGLFKGSDFTGFDNEPGAFGQAPTFHTPLPLSVVGDPFVQAVATFADSADFQATMQQPVGGMDRIPMAFEARLGNIIRKGCEVKRIRRTRSGADVFFFDKVTGQPEVISANYVICTLPLPVLATLDADFSKPVKAAIDKNKGSMVGGYKIAFQSPRFWETNDHIYGGLSFTDRDTFATWYPSDRLMSPTGVIIAGYAFDGKAGARSLPDQVAYARDTIDRLHPGQSGQMTAPVIVNWQQIPYTYGLASFLSDSDPDAFALLNQPDGPIYFAGDHLSYVSSWQQGAFLSAHRTVNAIADRVKAQKA